MRADEAEATRLLGATVSGVSYENGCFVLSFEDGQELKVGSDTPVWFMVNEVWLQ
jgi:hypothetical protein